MASVATADVSGQGKKNPWAFFDNLKNGVSTFADGVKKVGDFVDSVASEVKGINDYFSGSSASAGSSDWRTAYNLATDKLTGVYWR